MGNYVQALGDISSTIDAVAKITEDPALPEVACNVLRLNRVTEGKSAPPCSRRVYTAADRHKGVGLYAALPPLRAFVWTRQHPVAAVAVGAGVVGGLVALGYWLRGC